MVRETKESELVKTAEIGWEKDICILGRDFCIHYYETQEIIDSIKKKIVNDYEIKSIKMPKDILSNYDTYVSIKKDIEIAKEKGDIKEVKTLSRKLSSIKTILNSWKNETLYDLAYREMRKLINKKLS